MFDDAISMLYIIWSSMSTWFTPTFLFLFLNLMIGTIFITSSFSSSPSRPHHPDSALHHHHHHHQPPPSNLNRAPSLLHRLKSVNFYSSSNTVPPQQQQQQQNLSSTSNPSHNLLAPELELHHEVPTRAQTQTQTQTTPALHELGLDKVPARLQTRTQIQAQTQTRVIPNMRLEKIPARVRTQTQTQTQTRAPVIQEDMTDDEGPTLEEIYSRIKGTTTHHHNRQNSDTIPAGGEIPVKLPAKLKKSASEKSAFDHFETEITDEEVEEMEKLSAAMADTEVDAMADDFISRFKKQLQLQRIESIVRYKDMITRGSEK